MSFPCPSVRIVVLNLDNPTQIINRDSNKCSAHRSTDYFVETGSTQRENGETIRKQNAWRCCPCGTKLKELSSRATIDQFRSLVYDVFGAAHSEFLSDQATLFKIPQPKREQSIKNVL